MSGVETAAMLYGSAGTAATATTAATAATTGLIGAGGSFAWMPALSTLGVGLTAGSLVAGGFAQGGVADSNSDAATAAALAEEDAAARNAFALERKNRIEAEQIKDQQQRLKSKRAVAWGKSGVTMAGSPLEVETGAAYLDELALTQTLQGNRMAVDDIYYTAAQRSTKLRQQASLDSYMGGTYRTGGVLSGAGTLLTMGAKRYGG
jgi:hypothetical protein